MAKRGWDKRDIWKKTWKTPKIVIGIDESYTRTGISLAYKGKLIKVSSVEFKECRSKTEKRRKLANVLKKYIENSLKKATPEEIIIVCEKIRTFSSPGLDAFMKEAPVLSPKYIKATGALITVLVDTAFDYGIKVYSVDTRSWKSVVLGTSKPLIEPFEVEVNPQKIRAIRYIINQGFEESLKVYGKKDKVFVGYNDDAADSACIALYPFHNVQRIVLTLED